MSEAVIFISSSPMAAAAGWLAGWLAVLQLHDDVDQYGLRNVEEGNRNGCGVMYFYTHTTQDTPHTRQ
jgi:hypothetical protein